MDNKERKRLQVETVQELQDSLLKEFKRLLEHPEELTSTDRATIARFLTGAHWDLDPNTVANTLKDHITSKVDPNEFEEEEDIPSITSRRSA